MEYCELIIHHFLFKLLGSNLHCAFVVFAWESGAIVPPLPFPKSVSEKDLLPLCSFSFSHSQVVMIFRTSELPLLGLCNRRKRPPIW
jgi:hypothetical protein